MRRCDLVEEAFLQTLNQMLQDLSFLVQAPQRANTQSCIPRATRLRAAGIGLFAWLTIGAASPAASQGTQKKSWPEVKCERYKAAWVDALAHRSKRGLSPEFIRRHEAFLASGCTTRSDICPQSDEEFYLADMMVAAVVNAGIAGTFLPFMCRE